MNAAAPDLMPLAVFDALQHQLYGAVGRDQAWPGVVRAIAEALAADVACWCSTDGVDPHSPSFYAAWNLPDALNRAYNDHWMVHNPWLHAGMARKLFVQGSIFRGTDIVPAPALRQTPFYRDHLTQYPVEHMLTVVVSDGSVPGLAPPMLLNLFRRPERPDFDPHDVARLHLIYPHMLRAFDLHWISRRLQDQVSLLHDFLDALDFGVVMLDPAAQALYANQAARTLAATPDLARWLGGLPACVRGHDALGPLVLAAAQGHGGGLALGSEPDTVMALALPIQARAPTADTRPVALPGACILLLARSGQSRAGAADFVTRLFGLSMAEARVLPPLLRGASPVQMAAELGVQLSTVRTQLSAIFAKTGATRQQDLIRLLGSVPPIRC